MQAVLEIVMEEQLLVLLVVLDLTPTHGQLTLSKPQPP